MIAPSCVLGIDTSCYTTSCAAVDPDGHVLASRRRLLSVPAGERGLRQSEAVFQHVRRLPDLLESLLAELDGAVPAALCVSATPRDAADSYMPVFQAGESMARGIAAALRVPCYRTTHQRGHIAAARLNSGIGPGDLLALHLSGGTTELLALQEEELTLLGGTLDLHAGQLVDRCGVMLGLPFPAGPHLEALAVRGNACQLLPASVTADGLHCHFSGAEAQLSRWHQQQTLPPEDIACEVYHLLARTIARLLVSGSKKTGIRQALVAGGVASSALLRTLLAQRTEKLMPELRLCFGQPEFSGDNAVGVALIGAARWRASQA